MISRILICASLAAAPAGVAHASVLTGIAALDFGQEVAPSNPIPSPATGDARLVVDPLAETVDIHVSVDGIGLDDIQFPSGTLSFAEAGPFHIHQAPAGVNGPIVVPFNDPAAFSGTADTLEIKAEDVPFASTLLQPFFVGDLYFNLHTLDYGSGEIRGQIEFVPLPAGALLLLTALGAAGVVRGLRAA